MEKLIYFDRYVIYCDGRIKNAITGKFLKPGKNSRGYYTVSLYDGSRPKRCKSHSVHKLVACAFLGEQEGLEVNHKDGDKSNNRLDNLEWCTGQQNVDHARHVLGKHGYGEKNPRCKISAETIKLIMEPGKTAVAWAKELNCSADYIRQIRRGQYRSKG